GDYQLATALLTEARERLRDLGESGVGVPIADWLAEVALAQGDLDQALKLRTQALGESRARRDDHAIARSLRGLALLRRAKGSLDHAVALLRESLSLLAPLRDVVCVHEGLDALAGALSERGQSADAARLFGAAEALRERGRPLTPGQLAAHDRDVAAVERR